MNRPDRVVDARVGLGAAVFGLASSTAYVALRVASALSGEPTASSVLASAHVSYFWRVGLALFIGLIGAGVAPVLTRSPERWLARLTPVVLPTVLALIVTMLSVP